MLILVNLGSDHTARLCLQPTDPEEQRTNVLDIKLTKSLTIQNQILVILVRRNICMPKA